MSDERRPVIKSLGFGGAVIAAAQKRGSAQTANTPQIDRPANELHDAVRGYQVDDTHCHAVTDQYAETTPREFLLATSLAALPQAAYFPAGVLQRWRVANNDEKVRLDRQYGIEKTLDLMAYNARETIFTKYLTKELAGFLKCAPKFETVIAARNERAKAGYGRYISDLFRDIHLTNAMVDTGCCDGIGAGVFTTYAEAIRPCTMRAIARIEGSSKEILG